MTPIGDTTWACDPRWVSYALEQAERLKSHARAKKVMHNFDCTPQYLSLAKSIFVSLAS